MALGLAKNCKASQSERKKLGCTPRILEPRFLAVSADSNTALLSPVERDAGEAHVCWVRGTGKSPTVG